MFDIVTGITKSLLHDWDHSFRFFYWYSYILWKPNVPTPSIKIDRRRIWLSSLCVFTTFIKCVWSTLYFIPHFRFDSHWRIIDRNLNTTNWIIWIFAITIDIASIFCATNFGIISQGNLNGLGALLCQRNTHDKRN